VAVLDGEGRIEAEAMSSQVAAHARYGGVVPELASREHLRRCPGWPARRWPRPRSRRS